MRVLGLVLVLGVLPTAPGWVRADVLGMRLGVSTLKQARARFPGHAYVLEGSGPRELTWGTDLVQTPFGEAQLDFSFDARQRLIRVTVYSRQGLTRSELLERAGPMQSRTYGFLACEDAESAPVVPTAGGPFEYLLSPGRGLYARVEGERVLRVVYALGPPEWNARCEESSSGAGPL